MKFLVIAIGFPVVPILLACGYFATPTVFSRPSKGGVTIHCEVLHDYASNVGRIEITEAKSGQPVWLIKAGEDSLKLYSFLLKLGRNMDTLQPSDGRFQTVIPVQGPFYLKSGVAYRASVCSSDWFSICRTTMFTMDG
jgi:hypothetical protein